MEKQITEEVNQAKENMETLKKRRSTIPELDQRKRRGKTRKITIWPHPVTSRERGEGRGRRRRLLEKKSSQGLRKRKLLRKSLEKRRGRN